MAAPDAIVARALAGIDAAFRDAPRPPDEQLLHERCHDDNDIAALYGFAHWREVPDEVVEREYAALSFLSPAGFRHFVPAFLGFTLRRVNSGAAAVNSTIWSLAPSMYTAELGEFTRSKLDALDASQRQAVVAFLEAVMAIGDDHVLAEARRAMTDWRVT
jgi:hypothetical protein